MIGNPDVALDVLEARRDLREDGGHQIIALNALDVRRDLLAALEPQQRERAVGVPAPACAKDGRGQRRLLENFFDRLHLEVVKYVTERKAVLLSERDVQPVVGCCCLQLEIEGSAEALAQGKSPGLVHTPSERRMQDKLHAAALIEEAFGDDRLLRRDLAQHSSAGDDVLDQLFRTGIIQPALGLQPRDSSLYLGIRLQPTQALRSFSRFASVRLRGWSWQRRSIWQHSTNLLSQIGYVFGKLGRARRSLTAPEGNCRRRAVSILDHDPPRLRFHARDAP